MSKDWIAATPDSQQSYYPDRNAGVITFQHKFII